MRLLNKFFFDGFNTIVNPIGIALESGHVHPHTITAAGFLLSCVSALLFWKGHFLSGGIVLVISGACDVLDGRLARNTNRTSRFGAILDSTVDRYSEIIVFMGLAAFFHSAIMSAIILLALAGSLLTSYVRARAEGMGIECKIGLMQRPERVTFIAVGGVIGALFDFVFRTQRPLMILAILGIAIFSNFTVIQRVVYVREKIKSEIEKE